MIYSKNINQPYLVMMLTGWVTEIIAQLLILTVAAHHLAFRMIADGLRTFPPYNPFVHTICLFFLPTFYLNFSFHHHLFLCNLLLLVLSIILVVTVIIIIIIIIVIIIMSLLMKWTCDIAARLQWNHYSLCGHRGTWCTKEWVKHILEEGWCWSVPRYWLYPTGKCVCTLHAPPAHGFHL